MSVVGNGHTRQRNSSADGRLVVVIPTVATGMNVSENYIVLEWDSPIPMERPDTQQKLGRRSRIFKRPDERSGFVDQDLRIGSPILRVSIGCAKDPAGGTERL